MKDIPGKTVSLVPLITGTTLVLEGGTAEAATYNIIATPRHGTG